MILSVLCGKFLTLTTKVTMDITKSHTGRTRDGSGFKIQKQVMLNIVKN